MNTNSITFMNSFDKEYHPVIENYIADYAEENLDSVEGDAFKEVLVHDDDLRELAHSAKLGKSLLSKFGKIKAREGFEERLMQRIKSQN